MDDANDLAAAMALSMESPCAQAVRLLREKNSEQQLEEANSIQVLSTLLGNLAPWHFLGCLIGCFWQLCQFVGESDRRN